MLRGKTGPFVAPLNLSFHPLYSNVFKHNLIIIKPSVPRLFYPCGRDKLTVCVVVFFFDSWSPKSTAALMVYFTPGVTATVTPPPHSLPSSVSLLCSCTPKCVCAAQSPHPTVNKRPPAARSLHSAAVTVQVRNTASRRS